MAKPRKFTTRDAASPSTHTTARITVVERRAGGATFEVEGAEVELVGAGTTGKGTTNKSGVFTTGMVRAGAYDLQVRVPKMGPPQPPGKVVVPGTVTEKVTLLANTALPSGQTTNELTVVVQQENPRIHITVLEQDLLGTSTKPLQGASIEIIGLTTGTSDKSGFFTSPHAAFGKHAVHVKKAGFFPQNQDGDAFFREVELREMGAMGSGLSRDLEITVVLGVHKPAGIPPLVADPVSVWASGGHTPHTVLEDPRLPADEPKGQAGWDMGINYGNFLELARRLSETKPAHLGGADILDHQVSRLAIVAHGAPGVVDVDQKESGNLGVPQPKGSQSLTAARIGSYTTELDRIAKALRQNSVVILASCQAADGKEGEELLKALSRRWPTTTVVGLRTLATVVDGQLEKGESAMYAGVRDTRYANGNKAPGEQRDYEQTAFVQDLNKLPWLSESSPHATVARDGNIIRRGNPA
jgi:hypothetical protein